MINAYDFDGTIYDGDSSLDFYKFCLKRNKKVLLQIPKQIIGLILYILKIYDKTKFKECFFSYLKRIDNIDEYIKIFWKQNDSKIKEWYINQKNKTDVVISASPEFLLKPLEKKYKFKVIATIVDKKTGKFLSKNCHDYEKIARYEEKYNNKIKEFYSDSIKADYPMLKYAEEAYLVNKNEITKIDINTYKNTKKISSQIKNIIKLIRVKHWLKNALVFLPVFFSINIFNIEYLKLSFIGFLIFCFIASTVYVINDLNDIEKDKLHPIKKNRPLASGAISKIQAYILLILLLIISCLMMYYLYQINSNIGVIIVPTSYIILNILYSKGLKNIPIIDVVILTSGFLFRVMYGGIVTGITVSKYLYLMIIFGAFYLGFGKRRNEIIKNGSKSRKVLELYNKEFLDKNMYVMLGLAIVSYTLWCVDPQTILRVGNDQLFWTIPLLIIILQLYSLNIEGSSFADPIEVFLSDKLLILSCCTYLTIMVIILYII